MTGIFGALRLPASVVFGSGQRAAIGMMTAQIGKRALVCTDARLGSDAQFKAIVEDILPQQKLQLPKNVEELLSIGENEPTVPGHNGWGVINTVTYFTDHTTQYRGEEARFKSLTDGFASRLRNTARDRVLALA